MKKEITELDVSVGLANCADCKELYCEMLQSVLQYAPERLRCLQAYLEKKDYKNYIIEAHTLKSNATLIGALLVADKLKELEYAGKNKEYGQLEEKTESAITLYYDLLEEIKDKCSRF